MRKDDKYVSEVWCCDWDGANAKEITDENHLCVTPVFLPPSAQYSNDRFLYVSFKQGKSKIYIGSLSQTTGKRLIILTAIKCFRRFPRSEIKLLSSPMCWGELIYSCKNSIPKPAKWENRCSFSLIHDRRKPRPHSMPTDLKSPLSPIKTDRPGLHSSCCANQ